MKFSYGDWWNLVLIVNRSHWGGLRHQMESKSWSWSDHWDLRSKKTPVPHWSWLLEPKPRFLRDPAPTGAGPPLPAPLPPWCMFSGPTRGEYLVSVLPRSTGMGSFSLPIKTLKWQGRSVPGSLVESQQSHHTIHGNLGALLGFVSCYYDKTLNEINLWRKGLFGLQVAVCCQGVPRAGTEEWTTEGCCLLAHGVADSTYRISRNHTMITGRAAERNGVSISLRKEWISH